MHPNEKVVRDFYASFERRDIDELKRLVHPDVLYHEGGQHHLSGDYQGLENVLGFFGETEKLFQGNVEVEVHDVVAGDTHVVVLEDMRLSRGGKSVETKAVAVAHVDGGRITEMWELRERQPEVDALIDS